MAKQIVLIIFFTTLLTGLKSQETYQQNFLVFHNMLMKPDTMLFSFWHSGDTMKVKRILHQYVPMESTGQKMDFSFRRNQTFDAVKGSKLFNGKRIQYRFGTEKYLLRNDTLYKFILTNRLSRDSLDVLFGHGNNPKYFNKLDYQNNLAIIKENRIRIKKVIFYKGMFDNKKEHLLHGEKCTDTISLRRKWKNEGTSFYAITLNFNCLKYPKSETLIVDNNFRIHAFGRKYLSTEMTPYVQIKPFKARYFLKQ